ncbi:exosortase A [Erythrobacteraceae bacterium WH01K]|nr:exosortase A [Erythrobacteraceae bacterium WH01K]
MPPDIALQAIRTGSWRSRLPISWRRPLAHLALSWIALMVLTASAWAEMAVQWWNISTYNHILFIPPIVAWLVWLRRAELARLQPLGCWPGLVLVAGALFVWLLGELAGVNIVAQAGAVGALQMSVLAILGPRVTAGLLFPLAYMVFLVPFGDQLVPALQMITADVVIWLTRISGIPAVIDGVFIDTPAGLFEVAEACSGVKFLIAMIALGVLVAQTCFERWGRRLAFMATCIAVPIIANGVRAWGTIYIAQSQGIEFAAGFDHIFYGWIFFAIVVAVILGAAWRFFDRDPEEPGIDGQALAESRAFSKLEAFTAEGRSILLAIAAIILIFAAWNTLASRLEADLSDRLVAPQANGWTQEAPSMQLDWEPRASGADLRLLTSYVDGEGRRVDLFAAAYATQGPGRDPAAYGEGALVPDTDWRWLRSGENRPDATSDYLFALGSVKRLAQTSWRIGDVTTASAARLTLEAMRDKLLLTPRPALTVIVSAEDRPGMPADEAIAAFRRSTGPQDVWMDGLLDTP